MTVIQAESSRQADWASAVLQMLQNSALMSGTPIPGADAAQRSGPSSVASKTSRRQAPTVGDPRQTHTSVSLQRSSTTKAAAARTLNNSSSEDDETGTALTSFQASSEFKPQAPRSSEAHGSRSSRLHTASSSGLSAAAAAVTDSNHASSNRVTSSAGRAPTGSVPIGGSGGFTAAAAAAFESLNATASRQQHRGSRLRRASGNESVASEVSHPESVTSSKHTLGSSKLSATVQRVVARQRLLDSSSGEEDNATVPEDKQVDSDVGQAARLLARFKSLSSSGSASVFPSGGNLQSSDGIVVNGRKSPAAKIIVGKGAGSDASGSAPAGRPSLAPCSGRTRLQPADSQTSEVNAFTFGTKGGSSVVSDGISPRMRQAAAAATAEVSAAAASSLRPLPLTTIFPAHLTSPDRSRTAPQLSSPELQRAPSMASADGEAGFSAAAGAVARQAVAVAHPAHVSSSQRITTWLEQQPSLSSVGIADDIVSEYATTLTGTEIDLDTVAAGIKASARAAATVMQVAVRGDVKSLGRADCPKGVSSRSREIRLTISSDDEEEADHNGIDHVRKESAGEPKRCVSQKKISGGLQVAGKTQLAEDGAGRLSAGAANIQVALTAAAVVPPAARRLEFGDSEAARAAAPHIPKDLAPSYSSPSLRLSEGQSPGKPMPPSPSEVPKNTDIVEDKGAARKTASSASVEVDVHAAASSRQRLAAKSSLSPRQPKAGSTDGQRTKENSSSPESGALARPSRGGQKSKASAMATAGRLTPNELRVMLSVLSRPPWAGAPAHAVTSALSPQPSHSGDSLQSFSYSEMLQVMRAMSSSGGGENQRDGSSRDGSISSSTHKGSRKDSASGRPRSSKNPLSQQLHHQQLLRSARDLPSHHTCLEVKGSQFSQSVDGGSNSSLLGEHPMAAPMEREWSASASTVSDRGSEELQQRNFADMAQLWNLLIGRNLTPESLDSIGLHLIPDGAATPGSERRSPARVVSGAGGSVTHPSAAVLAASAAAMATTAVMAAAGGAPHRNAYLHAINFNPFTDAFTAASAANQLSHAPQQQQGTGSPSAAHGSKGRRAPPAPSRSSTRSQGSAATAPRETSPAQARSPRSKSTGVNSINWHEQQQDVQADLARLLRVLTAAGDGEVLPPDVSDATKAELSRLMQVLRNDTVATKGPDSSPSRRVAAVTAAPLSCPVKEHQAEAPATAAAVPAVPVAANSTKAESPRVRAPSSRRSSADTVETGLALGRLYQSLRNLRVRDEGDQTEGTERPIAQLTSGCVQTDLSDLQASAGRAAGEDCTLGTGSKRSLGAAGLPLQTDTPPNDISALVKVSVNAGTTGINNGALGEQFQSVLGMPGGCRNATAQAPTVIDAVTGKEVRVLKMPDGQLVEIDTVLVQKSDGATLTETVGDIIGSGGRWLQANLVVLDPSAEQDVASTLRYMSDGTAHTGAPPSLESDSVAGLGTSVTVGPAIVSAGATITHLKQPNHQKSEDTSADFPLRNLPIASEGGIMAAPNQEAVTAGRVGSAGGMLAYLEAADPTTATALLELVQALQLMTLHSRRRRWISDGSSTASGAYLVDPLPRHDSTGGSSGGATTLRYSFGTSIGPSVSQAGNGSLVDLPNATGHAVEGPAVSLPTKSASTGGVGNGVAVQSPQPKRQTHNAGLPPRPVQIDSEPTAKHLRRALRAVSGGGTMRLTPTDDHDLMIGGIGVANVPGGTVTPVTVAEAAKLHIARALELLSQPPFPSADTAPDACSAARAATADVELRAQEELVAALLALLAPGNFATQNDENKIKASMDELTAAPVTAADITGLEKPQKQGQLALQAAREHAVSAREVAVPAVAVATSEMSPVKLPVPAEAIKPISPLHARIQEVLQQAERASAGISSLQVGLSPTSPPAADVLEGVPFEQAIGFIMDGLRDFDGGPSHLARHLHLMYSPSSGGCLFFPTALDSLASRRQTAVALGAAAVLEAVAESVSGDVVTTAASEAGSEDHQSLTDAERERMQALVSEAVAAAEALARNAQREEAWNLERLGLLVDEVRADGQHSEVAHEERQQQIFAAPEAQETPPSPSALLQPSSCQNLQAVHTPCGIGQSRSVPSGLINSAAAPSEQAQCQSSQPASQDTVVTTTKAPVSPRRLIQQVADLGAGAMASLLPGMDPVMRPNASSTQRSAPVTTAGVVSSVDDASGAGGQNSAHSNLPGVPQTFGGAMDLPADSALGPVLPRSTPYLPCGDLDEQLRPILKGMAGISQQAPRSSCAPAGALQGGYPLLLQQQVQAQPAAEASNGTRLPTFATPSAPAVRGVATCSQPTSTSGTVHTDPAALAVDPRAASMYDGTTISKPVAMVGAEAAIEDEEVLEKDEMCEDGWESDMADAARICSPESNDSELASLDASRQSTAQQLQQQFANIPAGVASVLAESHTKAVTAEAANPQPSPHVTTGASTGGADPEVPALTARDRFNSPRPSYSPSPNLPTVGTASCSLSMAQMTAVSRTDAVSGASVEALPQQTSSQSFSDANGSFTAVRLARDVLSGQRTAPGCGPTKGDQPFPQTAETSLAASTSGEDQDGREATGMLDENRARRELFSATFEGFEQTPIGENAAASGPSEETERLLTQAAQLLLQSMQRAAEGQPEQEAAFRILAPVLQGLAAAGDKPFPQLDNSCQEAGRAVAEPATTSHEETCSFPLELGEAPATLRRDQQAQQLQQAAADPATDYHPQEEHQYLATAADLESFKEDVMASVRSALVEIVDMIGSTVVQRAGAAPVNPSASGGPGQRALVQLTGSGSEYAWSSADADHPPAPTDVSMSPERSASPNLGSEQQEIRITRAELEAFMFGKAVLGRSAADDLLGMRLRDLYAPQLPQRQDKSDEMAGIYDFTSTEPTPLLSPVHRRGSSPSRFGGALDAGEQGKRLEPVSSSPTAVPRDSPLRQPLADSAGFKSLFRRSIEHLRDHLQPGHSDAHRSPAVTGASNAHGVSQRIVESNGISTPAEELCFPSRFPVVPPIPRAPAPRQDVAVASACAGATAERALPDTLEVTLSPAGVSPQLAQQMAAAATTAAAGPSHAAMLISRSVTIANDDDVELEPHLSGGMRPEPTTDLARWPDPAAPAAQPPTRLQSQPQSRRGTAESVQEVQAIGDFLAALKEPMMQVVGVLTQPGGGAAGGTRVYPRNSVVIEEVTDEKSPSQLQLRPERPSRVPGFAATTSANHLMLEAEHEGGFNRISSGSGLAHRSSPRVASEADMSRVRQMAQERSAVALPHLSQARQHQHISRSASTTPVPRDVALRPSASVNVTERPPAAAPAASPASQQYPETQVHVQAVPSGASRLKMSSAPGTAPLATEDRPLSSFVSPSEGGAAPSHSRRRTHSPGPLARQAALRAEASRDSILSAPGIRTSRSVDVMAISPPGTSLDELESFLRAFRTRIGTDEAGNEPALVSVQHAVARTGSAATEATAEGAVVPHRNPFERHLIPELAAGHIAEVQDVRRDSSLSESVSVTTARRVISGFNVFTIRASGASALAAAAAVEETFSPRRERELAAAAAAAASTAGFLGSGAGAAQQEQMRPLQDRSAFVGDSPSAVVRTSEDAASRLSGPTDASHGSSSTTPTNPLLREHLEHFQALLEKANDLVDRLMLADEDLVSEGGATEVATTPLVSNTSTSSARRQLNYRLAQQRSGSEAVTPQRRATTPSVRALTPNTPADTETVSVFAMPTALPTAPTLDPELAALFPATAARLARPHARVEQSPDAVNSLLSSAVTAVPQLAKGADHIRSKGPSPPPDSPVGSTAGVPVAPNQPGIRGSVPVLPTPTQSAALATPLALVASLLAEAHSRMEFQSLEEQRGADRILSAVLDEHFAHVLGTPRGFLTPPRGSRIATSAGAAPTAAGVEAITSTAAPTQLQDTLQHQLPSTGKASMSGAFSRTFAATAETAAAEVANVHNQRPAPATKAPQPVAQKQAVLKSEDLHTVSERSRQVSSQSLPCTAGEVAQRQLQEPSSQERHEKMNLFLSQVMQQRANILTSALDHVHRVTGPPPSTAGPPAALLLGAQAAGMAAEATRSVDLSEPFLTPLPPADGAALTGGASGTCLDTHLPSSSIPGASAGLPIMPQPLMPYQELDSESTPTSFTASVACSGVHPESSSNWVHGTTNAFLVDSASLPCRVSSVVAASDAGTTRSSGSVLEAQGGTSDIAVLPGPHTITTSTVPEPSAAAEVRGGYDLSHLIDDDDGILSGGPSTLAVAPHLAAEYDGHSGSSGSGGGGASTLKTSSSLAGSHDHAPAVRAAPHETSLRYNPVYDPAGPSLGGSSTGTAFGAAAAAAVVGDLSSSFSDGGGFAAATNAMTTLHHETAYTPLAVAAGDASEGGAAGLESTLHSRLRSAGGTSTAVLVPNPMYDFPTEMDRSSQAPVSVMAAAVKAKAALTSDGGLTDVTMSLDFEEISREAAAVVDTLSAHSSVETAYSMSAAAATGTTRAVPEQSDANTPAPANAVAVVPGPQAASTDSNVAAAAQPALTSPVAITPGQKRHMGDMVAAAVRRFEAGMASVPSGTYEPSAITVTTTADSATASAELPSVNAIELIPSGSHSMSAGPSGDWQSIALSTGSAAVLAARRGTGAGVSVTLSAAVASVPISLNSGGSLLSLCSSAVVPAQEVGSTVHTREWVPVGMSQEIAEPVLEKPLKKELVGMAENEDLLVAGAPGCELLQEQREQSAAAGPEPPESLATFKSRPGNSGHGKVAATAIDDKPENKLLAMAQYKSPT
ncbi:hypothetical protein VOLCADRAFT_91219 [Volvox carteri f. nagariensis]|uniref:Uncharacterized protein n=1 Tax=Volvox carteri f. nagariensis TaxID=3068 RepID=D8TWH7_VOLCA|nr:uncharacterized protein VOLCADRAFT_91219 [Volvox carteri f. nagariensis]EFJ48048.1 hypothetical protein VOLCADRAFT_91219 [Volvox carteri f. nagariensis]|eukprot:XP_002950733.1 hypothetical protein VOLCADRAFT_91219 [Volvox carteri f. nagariensis]